MRKKTIKLIIILTALSLAGIIGTQMYWINSAVQLAKDQYDHRVTLALKNVIDDLKRYNKKDIQKDTNLFKITENYNVLQTIDTLLLDSLLTQHFAYQELDEYFKYAIIRTDNDSCVYCKEGISSEYFSVKTYKTCITDAGTPIDHYLQVLFPDKEQFIVFRLSVWLLISTLLLIIVVLCFAYIVYTMIRQKKISEIKNDFINNMTHELKTPISTISLASEVLLRANLDSYPEKTRKYSEIIFKENNRLKDLVERVLRVAVIDKGKFNLNIEDVDLHDLIRDCVDTFSVKSNSNGANFVFNLNAEKHKVAIDKFHFKNIITNLLDNAIKYSTSEPEVTLETKSNHSGLYLYVKDNGVGIEKEYQKHIFDKFYRVPTGNLHNVKGFGLGLHYVKNMTDAHNGKISIKSEVNKGSEFKIFIPYEFQNSN